ncbi:right-handed parallel beta-helix repeat-containing protein [Aquimarina sp. Aq78]|uniref:NosD domain-containing protein n=1 Tax=Aquimarina sp. Aq78 TaxID=1191889 RepID=UPI000D1113D5|nr:right-handed parallel beta-helix repeat-containing protein [Aquimarina sp. Aq78]
MKKLPYYLLIFMSCIAISCSKESVDDVAPVVGVETPDEETPTPDTIPNVVTTPCDFDLSTVAANSTIIFNCVLDLKGETVTLPANVKFEFDGGDVKNGKLIFAGGTIAGELLSSSIEIEGDVKLKEPTFKFFASRWEGIVEGRTTAEKALKNTGELERLLNFTKALGATTFEIGKFDAYFDITSVTSTTTNQNFYPSREAINIPSDFHLKMLPNTDDPNSPKTILRVFPTDRLKGGFILAFREVSNAKVSGGILDGKRDEQIYSNGFDTKEAGTHLMAFHSSDNIIADGVKFIDGSFGAVNIASIGFTFQPHYDPTHDITIKNCTFDNNRRMSMSITDGYNIYVENNTFLNTGLDSEHINGGVVGYAVNIEATRTRDASGNLILYEKAHKIFIRNNTERGSRVGGFTISIGEEVTIEGNDMENKIVYSATSDSKIRNNTFVATEKSKTTPAILAAGTGETVFNNEISGNNISGYGVAIAAYYGEVDIFGNQIINNSSGVQLKQIEKKTNIYGNLIKSSSASSRGISIQSTFANNVSIHSHNTATSYIDVKANHLYFVAVNQEAGQENYGVDIRDNTFKSSASVVFSKSKGVTYNNNTTNGPVLLVDASKVDLSSNEISSADYHGIALSGVNTAINTSLNKISFPAGTRFECINIGATTSPSEVTLDRNDCN